MYNRWLSFIGIQVAIGPKVKDVGVNCRIIATPRACKPQEVLSPTHSKSSFGFSSQTTDISYVPSQSSQEDEQ